MSMLNQAAVEALCSATYLENYLDCLENLPDDLQRNVSQMRELDALCCEYLKDIDHHHDTYLKETDNMLKKRSLIQIQQALIRCQEIGDEKLQVVSQILDHIENRTRQLEQDLENLDPEAVVSLREDNSEPRSGSNTRSQREDRKESSKRRRQGRDRENDPTPAHAKDHEDDGHSKSSNSKPAKSDDKHEAKSGVKRQRRQRQHLDSMSKEDEKKDDKDKPKKKKKRKNKKEKEGDKSPIGEPIDPDEPTYCLCDQVSYGEMIGCDNDDCQIEWFHFNCVHLTTKPKGKWYCPKCRGDTSKVKRADLK